jgi:hypothetical protein
MFFKDYFNSVAQIIDFKYQGHSRKKQNPVDKGELCEIFMKDFLIDTFSDNFKIFRGGKIVSSDNGESKQLDIVLCSKKSIKIFGDKGIYPIETVCGVFSVTATFGKSKLNTCLKEFQSIPKRPKFFYSGIAKNAEMTDDVMLRWNQFVPFKCIWAYSGSIQGTWILDLNKIIKDGKIDRHLLPDLIVVNKKGMLLKNHAHFDQPFADGVPYYLFQSFKKVPNPGACFGQMLHSLFLTTTWQDFILPRYDDYFSKDL